MTFAPALAAESTIALAVSRLPPWLIPISAITTVEDESEISLGFDTAWAPALGAYEKFIDKNSNCSLKAYYYEPGCDFMGEWDNGMDSCFEVAKYGLDDDFWKQGIGSTLDDMFGITESMRQYLEDTMMDEEVYKYSKGEKVNIGEDV